MSKERIVELEIDIDTGIVTSDTLNFVGKECEALQDGLTKALAGDLIEQTDKPEKEAQVQEVQIAKQNVRTG